MEEKEGTPEPNVVPDKIIYLIHAFRTSQALFTACDLGIFDMLHTSSIPLSAQEISHNMSSNTDATTRLLDGLVTLELLEKTKQGDLWLYNNTTIANKFLTRSSLESLVDYAALNNKTGYPMFANLASAVREGTPQWMKTFGRSSQELWKEQYENEEACLKFMSAMHGSSLHGSDAVARTFDLTAYTKCCDLGGSAGTMAYALCQYNPRMKITVCELPSVVNCAHHFKPSIEACPNQGNVSFVACDFIQSDLPKADLYVLCRTLHDWSDEKVDIILSKVFESLPSGGALLICEQILNEDKSGPEEAVCQSLNMLLVCEGKERSAKEYKQVLEKHGFVDIQVKLVHITMDAILCKKI